MRIQQGSRVLARGRVHDEAGNLLDAGERPFSFTIGRQETISGVERAVIGHRAGDWITFACPPELAYGPHRPELVFETRRENLPADARLAPGVLLSPGGSDGRFQLKVLELTETGARLDGNHPLSGRTLRFELQIIEVSSSSPAPSE